MLAIFSCNSTIVHMTVKKDDINEIVAVISMAAEDKRLLGEFLIDLLTPAERREIAARWQIIKQLDRGIPQRKIAENLGVSVATVSRGAREMLDPKGGFHKVLARFDARKARNI